MKIIIGPNQKPPKINYGTYERGLDPWHRDAFPNHLKDVAPNQEKKRKMGWFINDWAGNQISFYPDGMEYE